MSNKYTNIKDIAYLKYQLDWIVSHGFFISDLSELAFEWAHSMDSNNISFEEYLEEHGFGGELWACREEFLETEYRDLAYMQRLLTPGEYEEYKKEGIHIYVTFEGGFKLDTLFLGTIDELAHKLPSMTTRSFDLIDRGANLEQEEKAVAIHFPKEDAGVMYSHFGCTWKYDRIYMADEKDKAQFELIHPVRFTAHVIQAPEGYQGTRNMDAAWRIE
ncbi:MAG: hypothetical protein LUE86_01475 [Clostridiales bacterium]|nr:hypothetical protein [Clostridiales bacterium]